LRERHWSLLCVAFSPDGKQVAAGGADKQVKLWHTSTGKELRTLGGHARVISAVALHPDGRRPAVGARGGGVGVWGPSTGREALTLHGEHVVRGLTFLPDGTSLVAACDDGFLRLWNGTPLDKPLRKDRE